MKKVAFMFVAALAMTFASCGGNKTANAECADSCAFDSAVEEVVDTVVVDSVVADSAVVAE